MKRALTAAVLAIVLCLSSAPALAAGSWYDDSVKICEDAGLMRGNGRDFNPGGTLTVYEAAAIAARLNEQTTGYPIPARGEGEPWYAPYVAVMEHIGVDLGGDPGAPATREDFVRILAAVLPDDSTSPINSVSALPDSSSPDVLRLCNAGILTGVDKYGTFAGYKTLTRAEAAAMAARMVTPALRVAFTPAPLPEDPVLYCLGIPGDTTLLTVDGQSVPAWEYAYFLGSILNIYGPSDPHDFSQEEYAYMKDVALESAKLYALIEAKAAQLGITLTAEQKEELDAMRLQNIKDLGGEAGYLSALRSLLLTSQQYDKLSGIYMLSEGLKERSITAAPTEDELTAYADTQGYMLAKHIFIKAAYTYNDPLPEAEIAAAKQRIEALQAQLKQSGDPIALFDKLMNEYSQDGRTADGALMAPDGYLFRDGEMVAEFERAVKDLGYGEISGVVKTIYGYHLVLRLKPVNDEVRALWRESAFNDLLQTWVDGSTVTTTPAYDSLDMESFLSRLAALQDAEY